MNLGICVIVTEIIFPGDCPSPLCARVVTWAAQELREHGSEHRSGFLKIDGSAFGEGDVLVPIETDRR